MKTKIKQWLCFLFGMIVLIVLDQWTKQLAVAKLMGQEPFVLWEGVFEFFYSENRGAAFGMLQGRQGFFFVVAVVVMAVIGYMMIRMPLTKQYLPLTGCLMLVGSGALGNMIDRVTQGYVVDFLYFKLINFPIFNVADCYVVVSMFLLVCLIMFYYKEEDLDVFSWKHKKGEADCSKNL
ncbi:MAG: signal peptidase II [Lachnospiraceae bacterium]